MADFDWWSAPRLRGLANLINAGPLPPVSYSAFWLRAASQCGFDTDEASLEELAQDVHNEIEGFEECAHETDDSSLITGDLSLAESRLMLMVKNIKGVAYVASHQLDPLWKDDGIEYQTLIVSPGHLSLSAQLSSVCAFLHAQQPALVCSSCPKLRATVVGSYLLYSGEATELDDAIDQLKARGLDDLGSSEREALAAFAEGLQADTPAASFQPVQVDKPKMKFTPHQARHGMARPSLVVEVAKVASGIGGGKSPKRRGDDDLAVLSPSAKSQKKVADEGRPTGDFLSSSSAPEDDDEAHSGLTPKMKSAVKIDCPIPKMAPLGGLLSGTPTSRIRIFKRDERISEEAL